MLEIKKKDKCLQWSYKYDWQPEEIVSGPEHQAIETFHIEIHKERREWKRAYTRTIGEQ